MVFTPGLLFAIFLLLVIVAHLLYFFERSDDNTFPVRYLEGIKESVWEI